MVQLTDELLARLDDEARRSSRSRSALIRDAVEHYLSETGEAAIDRAIAEGYARIPPGQPDGWTGIGALGDHGTRELGQRLDEEERAAGFGPW